MSFLLLLLSPEDNLLKLTYTGLKLVNGHTYRLTIKLRSNVEQNPQFRVTNNAGDTETINESWPLAADSTKVFKIEFTPTYTENDAILEITFSPEAQELYFDDARLIDLTLERKEYRVMRIIDSQLAGSYIQTLTLREKTASESD